MGAFQNISSLYSKLLNCKSFQELHALQFVVPDSHKFVESGWRWQRGGGCSGQIGKLDPSLLQGPWLADERDAARR